MDLSILPFVSGGLLPLLIFLAELCVVTLSTIRIIFVARGLKFFASFLGFFEVLTWLFAITQIMQNMSNGACFLAFAGGFSLGNFLGILIEKKLAMGSSIVHIFTQGAASALVADLRAAEYGVTALDGKGAGGPVRVLCTVVRRKEVDRIVALIRRHEPEALYAIDEPRAVSAGGLSTRKAAYLSLSFNPLKLLGVRRNSGETGCVSRRVRTALESRPT
jgi:uncharacterized protein YebE (UPF0316 family)